MTNSINWPITVRSAVAFRSVPEIISSPYTVITSEALGTCERLAQGRYSAMRRPGVEPATLLIAICKSSALTTTLSSHTGLQLTNGSGTVVVTSA